MFSKNQALLTLPILVNDNMPDKLKNAINYLNENNISLTDKIEVDFGDDDDDQGGDFDGFISDNDLNDTEFEEDDIYEEDVDLSDLDSIF